ncbi:MULTISPECIES: aldose epimerase family protein [unclassified Vibrio]|uniref:aldose epimerase family protein n=1 Tax=unclassified Vibrio TaxID=2614977 RepID=UPI00159E4631|nr:MULTISPECIES: aldose epimerase family protein [unclassified Vibrio]NVN80558.1 galactose mutarotase [Vibrio sp. Scap16]QLE95627.1 galactose mutarotase [Vibrio sp. Scap24]
MQMTDSTMMKRSWGKYSVFVLSNLNGISVEISDLGASIIKYVVKDKDNHPCNIVLGYDTPEEYLKDSVYMGAVVGPWGNRIRNAEFKLNGVGVQLDQNEGTNHLHGGACELHKKQWKVMAIAQQGISLQTEVKKGEAGYPANLTFNVTYRLSDENELAIQYWVEADEECPINPTHHAYFNLSGQKKDISEHIVSIDADSYWKTDQQSIPIDHVSVNDTVMDFLNPKKIGIGLLSDHDDIKATQGYDHCYILNGYGLRPVGWVYEPSSGIALEVISDRPAVQFYTGNNLDEHVRSDGRPFRKYGGFCFETQAYPNQINMDGINHDVICSPDRPFRSTTIFKVEVEASFK